MTELLPVSICGILLSYVSHTLSKFDKNSLTYKKKESAVWFAMAVIMAVFVGLRVAYNDTFFYIHAYDLMDADQPIMDSMDWQLGSNPGFTLLNLLIKKAGFSSQSFIMLYAVITVGIYLWFIRKYTDNLWFTLFLFITMGCFTFTMAAIKQCVAVAFALLATDRAIQKKYVRFALWVIIAMLFHPYAIMYIVVPFMTFAPWTNKTWMLLLFFGLAGVLFQFLVGTVVSITSMMGETYDAASFTGDGINPFRLAVVTVPSVLSFMVRDKIQEENNPVHNVMVNLTMLNAEIMFVGLFGTANYFGRLANYFLIFQTISLPWLISKFKTKNAKSLTVCAVIGYIAYFVYANALNQPFDLNFRKISLIEYIRSLF